MYEQSDAGTKRRPGHGEQVAGISQMGEGGIDADREDSVALPRGFSWLDRGQGLALTAGFWIGFVVGRMP